MPPDEVAAPTERPSDGASPPTSRAAPRVQAVVATREGRHLEATLSSLGRQTWADLSLVVVLLEPPSVDPGPAARRHGATVLSAAPGEGLAGAARQLIGDAGLAADWRLFCREGAVFDHDCVSLLMTAAETSAAGIAGPKVVDAVDASVLREVGLSSDRFGVAFTSVDPEEVDHGQHDGTREVLFVSTTCLLVRAPLFDQLGGFDTTFDDIGIDLDLCWRALIVDGPVIVVPEARVRVPNEPTSTGDISTPVATRNRLRTILKCYSFFRLLVVLIQMAALGLAEMAALTLARRGRDARRVPAAWLWNMRHLPSTLALRWRVQRRRRTSDRVIRRVQVSGSSRVREYLESRLAGTDGGPLAESAAGDHLGEELRSAARAPQVLFWLALLGVVAVSVRALVTGVLPEGGQLLSEAPQRGLLSAYISPWRFDALGSPGGGPVHLLVFAAARVVGLGSLAVGLKLLLVGAYLAALIGVWRLVSRLDPWPAPALAVLVYATSPLLLAATELGDLGGFWMWSLAPFLLARLLDGFDRRLAALPSACAAGLVLALAATLFPLAPLVYFATATALVVGSLLAGQRLVAVATWLRAVAAVAIAAVLLLPASLQWMGLSGASPFRSWYLDWSQLRVAIGAGEAIRMQVGTVGGGVLGAAVPVAALFAVGIARRQRLEWAIRLWAVALTGMAFMFLAGQDLSPAAPRLLPGAVALAGVALAALCGLFAGAIRRDLSDYPLGWRHISAIVVAAAVVMSLLAPFGRLLSGGRLGFSPDELGRTELFLAADDERRMLWLGRPGSLPGDPYPLPDQIGAYVVTRGRPGISDILPAAARDGDVALAETLNLIRRGTTQRGGRLLAPFGIGWVVVVLDSRPARVDGPPADPNLIAALGQQLDLAEKRIAPDLAVYENTSVLGSPVLLDREELVAVARMAGPALPDALQAVDLGGVPAAIAPTGAVGYEGHIDAPEGGLLLLQEADDSAWAAVAEGVPLPRETAFGWATGFPVPPGTVGSVRLEPSGVGLRGLAVAGQGAAWLMVLVLWRRRPEKAAAEEPAVVVDEPALVGARS